MASKKYTAGDDQARVLEFSKLTRRPLIRPAQASEIPIDFSTRVSVLLSPAAVNDFTRPEATSEHGGYTPRVRDTIIQLICGIDVEIEIDDQLSGHFFKHSGNWDSISSEAFLTELLAPLHPDHKALMIKAHADQLRPIKADDGSIIGRAALRLINQRRLGLDRAASFLVSVGGFGYRSGKIRIKDDATDEPVMPPLVGILAGSTEDASRSTAQSIVAAEVLAKWVTEQASLIDATRMPKDDLVTLAHSVMSAGGKSCDLPFCFCGGSFISWQEMERLIAHETSVAILLEGTDYRKTFVFKNSADLNARFFTSPVRNNIIGLVEADADIHIFGEEFKRACERLGRKALDEEEIAEIISILPIRWIAESACRIWASELSFAVARVPVFSEKLLTGGQSFWALVLERRASTAPADR